MNPFNYRELYDVHVYYQRLLNQHLRTQNLLLCANQQIQNLTQQLTKANEENQNINKQNLILQAQIEVLKSTPYSLYQSSFWTPSPEERERW